MDEEMFWEGVGCDPIFYAMALWGVTGNHALGEQIVLEAHNSCSGDASAALNSNKGRQS
jgi:hypothetical protein